MEAIKTASDELQKAFYPVAERMYQQEQGGQGGQGGAGAAGGDNVVDADYETVD